MTTLDATLTRPTVSKAQVDYIMQWRELWADHVYWTRFVVEGIIDKVPGLPESIDRLMASCSEMRDLVRPYYGDAAAQQFGDLMTTHLQQAADLVTQAAQNDPRAATTELEWYENADEIARFLAGANPHLEEGAVRGLLHEHLRVTKEEAVARLQKDYVADIKDFNQILHDIYTLSDALSAAVIQQFPERFEA